MPSPERPPAESETCSGCGKPYTEHAPDCVHLLAVKQEFADLEAANAAKFSQQMADIAAFHNQDVEVPEMAEVQAELSPAERAKLLEEIKFGVAAINKTVSEALGVYQDRKRAASPSELPDLDGSYASCMERSGKCRAAHLKLQPLEKQADAELIAFNDQQLKPCLQAWAAFVRG